MSQKQRGLIAVAILLIGAVSISGCTFSLSKPPAATPTLIPTGLFVSPFPSVENPMEMIEEFARATAAAQTTIASGGTPAAPVTVVSTVLTPQTGGTPTLTSGTPSTPTNALATAAAPFVPTVTPGGPTVTPVPPLAKPASYTLQRGEFPYCIARRYNVNPDELLALNGLVSNETVYPGAVLKIPQSGNPFPGSRALQTHPSIYTVPSSDETVYGVACKYGDVDPAAIAQANGISVSAALTAGQQLKIP